MIELSRDQLDRTIERARLFQELLELGDARLYRAALRQGRAWRLAAGEALPDPERRRGAYALIPDRDGDPGDGETPALPRRIFGQRTGLRGQPLDEPLVATEPSVAVEIARETLELLLGVASRFKFEFFHPMVVGLEPLRDLDAAVLEPVIIRSPFRRYADGEPIVRRGELGASMFFILAGEAVVETAERPRLGRGDFFGEIAVLSRQERVATVSAAGECLAMECGRDPVTHVLLRKSRILKALVEERFRRVSMLALLREAPFFAGLDTEELKAVCALGTLETFDPYEPLFFQGDRADALYVIVNGMVNVVESTEEGPRPLAWVRGGATVGEIALFPELAGTDRRGQTVTALQHVDAIRFSAAGFAELTRAHPQVGDRLRRTAESRLEENRRPDDAGGRAGRMAWIMETQHLQGRAVLGVDMDDCIRCGNCVTACQSVHADGLNRFHWPDMRQEDAVMPHVRLSNSCQHCEYPLCCRNCPTNAIDRSPVSGAVVIDYDLCIRCGKCADANLGCPYGSITVVPAERVNPRASLPLFQWLGTRFGRGAAGAAGGGSQGKKYPVKCDLCPDLPYEACAYHCPTGAVFRVDGDTQFGMLLRGKGTGSARAAPETVPLFLDWRWEAPTRCGRRPVELRVSVRERGPGTPIRARRPEPGVSALEFNLYLHAPDLRVGSGSLRQLRLTPGAGESAGEYAIGSREPAVLEMPLLAYQGGLYLGHTVVRAEFTPEE